ncbi:MAG TPA: hypothetical protein DCW71_03450 [Alistipes sp.]|nr:hypothetical protein [Alistipes sp.]
MIRGRGAELIALWKRACACGGIADSGGNRLFRDVSAEGAETGVWSRDCGAADAADFHDVVFAPDGAASLFDAVCAPKRGGLSLPSEILGRAVSEQAANAPAADRHVPVSAMVDVFRANE